MNRKSFVSLSVSRLSSLLCACWLGGAWANELSVSLDVLVCQDQVLDVLQVESRTIFPNSLDLLREADPFSDLVIGDLKILSPNRARWLETWLREQWPRLQRRRGVDIQRYSTPSPLVIPEGCKVQVLASLSAPSGAVVLNQDLFERLSRVGQELILIEIALQMEQLIFSFDDWRMSGPFRPVTPPFDLVRARDFLRCWLSRACRPRTLRDFHQMIKALDFDFFEQDGVLISNRDQIVWSSAGLVRVAFSIVQSFDDALFDSYWSSFVTVRDKNYRLRASDLFDRSLFLRFDNFGKGDCAPIRNVSLLGLGEFSLWSESDVPWRSPVCWSRDGSVRQGHLVVPWESGLKLNLGPHHLVISKSPSVGGQDQGTLFVFHENGFPSWIADASGQVSLDGRLQPFRGMVNFRAEGSVDCVQLEPQTLRCFDPQGAPTRSIDLLEARRLMRHQMADYTPTHS